MSSLIFLHLYWQAGCKHISGVSAQLTPTANLAGGRILPDARPGPEVGGFQALFASASQDMPGDDGGTAVPAGAGKSSAPVEADRVGKKTPPDNERGGDADGVLSALAAALVMAAPVATVGANVESGAGTAETEPCAGVGDSSPGPGPLELRSAEGNLTAARPTAAAGETAFARLQNGPVPADIFGGAAEVADGKTRKSAVEESEAGSKADWPETADRLPAGAAQAVADASRTVVSKERQGAAPMIAAPVPATPAASYGQDGTVSEGVSLSATAQVTAMTEGGTAVAVSSAQPFANATPEADQAGTRDVAERDRVPSGAVASKAAAAQQSQVRFAVNSTAEKSDRQGRVRSFGPAEDNASDGDDFSAMVQNSASTRGAAPVVNQGTAAPAPHATSPSPPAPERAAKPDAARADINLAPAPPALQTAQVLQRVDKAEIRIGLQSADFGAIRLHTTVANDQVGAAVSTSHAGLRDALLAEAPSLEKAIARHSLHLDSVNLDAGGAGSNSPTNSFGSKQRQPSPASTGTARAGRSQPAGTPASATVGGSYRLDVRV